MAKFVYVQTLLGIKPQLWADSYSPQIEKPKIIRQWQVANTWLRNPNAIEILMESHPCPAFTTVPESQSLASELTKRSSDFGLSISTESPKSSASANAIAPTAKPSSLPRNVQLQAMSMEGLLQAQRFWTHRHGSDGGGVDAQQMLKEVNDEIARRK